MCKAARCKPAKQQKIILISNIFVLETEFTFLVLYVVYWTMRDIIACQFIILLFGAIYAVNLNESNVLHKTEVLKFGSFSFKIHWNHIFEGNSRIDCRVYNYKVSKICIVIQRAIKLVKSLYQNNRFLRNSGRHTNRVPSVLWSTLDSTRYEKPHSVFVQTHLITSYRPPKPHIVYSSTIIK